MEDGGEEEDASKDRDLKEQPEELQQAEEEAGKHKGSEAPARKERQPSLSLQSRMRSESFKRSLTSTHAGADSSAKSPNLKSPPLPTTGEEGDAVQDIYKRQKERIHALEEENKKLLSVRQEKEALEDEIQELREKQGETANLDKNEASGEEVDKLVCRCTPSDVSA